MYLYELEDSSQIKNLSIVAVCSLVSWVSELAGSTPIVLPVAPRGEFAVTDVVPIGLVLRLRLTNTPVELSITACTSEVDVVIVPVHLKSPVDSTVSVESLRAVLVPSPSCTTCSDADTVEVAIFSNRPKVSLILVPLRLAITVLLKQRY